MWSRRGRWRLATGLAAAAAAGLAVALLVGCQRPEPAPSIVLVTVDTLRADHLGLYGYPRPTSPNLDRRFASGATFERAYAPASFTSPSVVSCLTGQLPSRHGVRRLFQAVSDDAPTVARLLAGRGYRTAAVVSNLVLDDASIGLAGHFDHYDAELAGPGAERDAAATTDAAIRWLSTVSPGEPSFLWVHYFDPHAPYEPPAALAGPPGRSARTIELRRLPAANRIAGLDDGLAYVDRYDGEIAFVDREVERLLETHRRLGLGERRLVVITSDHGERLLEERADRIYFAHGQDVHQEQVRVPLALVGPGIPAGRVAAPVSLLDVAPTILRWAGAPVPPEVDGEPLFPRPLERPIFVETTDDWYGHGLTSNYRGMILGDDKWVAHLAPNGALARAVRYDLATDPGETTPLAVGPDDEDGPYGLLLERIAADPDRGAIAGFYLREAAARDDDVTDEERKRREAILRSLGYLE